MSLRTIIPLFNESLKEAFSKYSGAKFYGIAETVIRKSGTVVEKLPAVLDEGGNLTYVGVDDTAPLIVYHKIKRLSTTLQQNAKDSFGRIEGIYTNTFSLSLFVYYDYTKIPLLQDEVYMLILANLGGFKTVANYKTVLARVSEVILNTQQVFLSEYSGMDFKLPAEKRILEVQYLIEGRFDKSCLDNCRC